MPDDLPGAGGARSPRAPAAAALGWREYFADAQLRSVVELALADNRDLRIAALNVEKAAALYRIQRAELSPGFGVQAAGRRTRLPERMTESRTAPRPPSSTRSTSGSCPGRSTCSGACAA